MSLGIIVKGPEGIVIASESRLTLGAQLQDGTQFPVSYDTATKILHFTGKKHRFVGAVTYGAATIGPRSPHSFLPELELEEKLKTGERMTIEEYAKLLSDFFYSRWQEVNPAGYIGPQMTFVVAGYNEAKPYGEIYVVDIPSNREPVLRTPEGEFGIVWGGQREIVDRILKGCDDKILAEMMTALSLNEEQQRKLSEILNKYSLQIPLAVLPLQDCVDLAYFFVKSTIDAQRLTVTIRGCGGPVNIAIITREEGFRMIRENKIAIEEHGEYSNRW